MTNFVWPAEDGWPYPDAELEVVDLASDPDDDLLSLEAAEARLLAALDPVERTVVCSRFGLAGSSIRTMEQLEVDLGLPADDLNTVLGTGLAKLRTGLTA